MKKRQRIPTSVSPRLCQSDYIKLNVDSLSKGNLGPSGGIGVIRVASGKVLIGFSSFFGEKQTWKQNA